MKGEKIKDIPGSPEEHLVQIRLEQEAVSSSVDVHHLLHVAASKRYNEAEVDKLSDDELLVEKTKLHVVDRQPSEEVDNVMLEWNNRERYQPSKTMEKYILVQGGQKRSGLYWYSLRAALFPTLAATTRNYFSRANYLSCVIEGTKQVKSVFNCTDGEFRTDVDFLLGLEGGYDTLLGLDVTKKNASGLLLIDQLLVKHRRVCMDQIIELEKQLEEALTNKASESSKVGLLRQSIRYWCPSFDGCIPIHLLSSFSDDDFPSENIETSPRRDRIITQKSFLKNHLEVGKKFVKDVEEHMEQQSSSIVEKLDRFGSVILEGMTDVTSDVKDIGLTVVDALGGEDIGKILDDKFERKTSFCHCFCFATGQKKKTKQKKTKHKRRLFASESTENLPEVKLRNGLRWPMLQEDITVDSVSAIIHLIKICLHDKNPFMVIPECSRDKTTMIHLESKTVYQELDKRVHSLKGFSNLDINYDNEDIVTDATEEKAIKPDMNLILGGEQTCKTSDYWNLIQEVALTLGVDRLTLKVIYLRVLWQNFHGTFKNMQDTTEMEDCNRLINYFNHLKYVLDQIVFVTLQCRQNGTTLMFPMTIGEATTLHKTLRDMIQICKDVLLNYRSTFSSVAKGEREKLLGIILTLLSTAQRLAEMDENFMKIAHGKLTEAQARKIYRDSEKETTHKLRNFLAKAVYHSSLEMYRLCFDSFDGIHRSVTSNDNVSSNDNTSSKNVSSNDDTSSKSVCSKDDEAAVDREVVGTYLTEESYVINVEVGTNGENQLGILVNDEIVDGIHSLVLTKYDNSVNGLFELDHRISLGDTLQSISFDGKTYNSDWHKWSDNVVNDLIKEEIRAPCKCLFLPRSIDLNVLHSLRYDQTKQYRILWQAVNVELFEGWEMTYNKMYNSNVPKDVEKVYFETSSFDNSAISRLTPSVRCTTPYTPFVAEMMMNGSDDLESKAKVINRKAHNEWVAVKRFEWDFNQSEVVIATYAQYKRFYATLQKTIREGRLEKRRRRRRQAKSHKVKKTGTKETFLNKLAHFKTHTEAVDKKSWQRTESGWVHMEMDDDLLVPPNLSEKVVLKLSLKEAESGNVIGTCFVTASTFVKHFQQNKDVIADKFTWLTLFAGDWNIENFTHANVIGRVSLKNVHIMNTINERLLKTLRLLPIARPKCITMKHIHTMILKVKEMIHEECHEYSQAINVGENFHSHHLMAMTMYMELRSDLRAIFYRNPPEASFLSKDDLMFGIVVAQELQKLHDFLGNEKSGCAPLMKEGPEQIWQQISVASSQNMFYEEFLHLDEEKMRKLKPFFLMNIGNDFAGYVYGWIRVRATEWRLNTIPEWIKKENEQRWKSGKKPGSASLHYINSRMLYNMLFAQYRQLPMNNRLDHILAFTSELCCGVITEHAESIYDDFINNGVVEVNECLSSLEDTGYSSLSDVLATQLSEAFKSLSVRACNLKFMYRDDLINILSNVNKLQGIDIDFSDLCFEDEEDMEENLRQQGIMRSAALSVDSNREHLEKLTAYSLDLTLINASDVPVMDEPYGYLMRNNSDPYIIFKLFDAKERAKDHLRRIIDDEAEGFTTEIKKYNSRISPLMTATRPECSQRSPTIDDTLNPCWKSNVKKKQTLFEDHGKITEEGWVTQIRGLYETSYLVVELWDNDFRKFPDDLIGHTILEISPEKCEYGKIYSPILTLTAAAKKKSNEAAPLTVRVMLDYNRFNMGALEVSTMKKMTYDMKNDLKVLIKRMIKESLLESVHTGNAKETQQIMYALKRILCDSNLTPKGSTVIDGDRQYTHYGGLIDILSNLFAENGQISDLYLRAYLMEVRHDIYGYALQRILELLFPNLENPPRKTKISKKSYFGMSHSKNVVDYMTENQRALILEVILPDLFDIFFHLNTVTNDIHEIGLKEDIEYIINEGFELGALEIKAEIGKMWGQVMMDPKDKHKGRRLHHLILLLEQRSAAMHDKYHKEMKQVKHDCSEILKNAADLLKTNNLTYNDISVNILLLYIYFLQLINTF